MFSVIFSFIIANLSMIPKYYSNKVEFIITLAFYTQLLSSLIEKMY